MYDFPAGFVDELSALVSKYNLAFIDYLGIISLFSNTLIKELINRYEILSDSSNSNN